MTCVPHFNELIATIFSEHDQKGKIMCW